MRILSLILVFIATLQGSAQTTNANKPVRIKGNPMLHLDDYNTWDVGVNMGCAFPQTDITGEGLGFGIGFDATKFLSHSFALQARFIHANLHGQDINKPEYRYNTTVNYDITVNVLAQIGNVSFLKRIPNLAFYGTMGFGMLHYSPEVSLNGGATYLPGIYSQYESTYDTMDYQGRTDIVVPFGIGVKYRVSESLSLTGEYSVRTTNTDKLDGFYKLLSADDSYSYFSAGVCVHLGSNNKTIEWENPLDQLYNDLYEMKDKFDRVAKDSDGDGVTDQFDKEPATPAGAKVYGDGTSVDSDGDGIPDVRDAELFSSRNAKVDASGKEIVEKAPAKVETYVPPVVPEKVVEKPIEKPIEKEIEKPIATETRNTKGKPVLPEFVDGNVMPSVYFGLDNFKIDKQYYPSVAKIALYMMDHPQENYRIVGISDGRGNQYNMSLAKKRAESVKNHLIKNYKIDPSRMKTEALGKAESQSRNPLNRRVDIKPE